MATVKTDMTDLTPEDKRSFRIRRNPKKRNMFYEIDYMLTLEIENSTIKFKVIFPPAGTWPNGRSIEAAETPMPEGTVVRECEMEIYSAFKPGTFEPKRLE